MSAQHVVSRSVRDSAVALDSIAGPMPGDPYTAPSPAGLFAASAGAPPGRLRIGLCVAAPGGEAVDPMCVAAAEATASRCEALGHHIEEISWPFAAQPYAVARSSVIAPYVAAAVDQRLEALGRALQPDDLEPLSRMIYDVGRRQSAVELVAGMQAMHHVGRTLGGLFTQIDVLLTPTLAALPGPLGRLSHPDQDALGAIQALTAFTVVANVSGQPAMSVPLDRAPSGLPIGSQFLGRFGEETTLYSLAGQLERAHPWPWFPPELRG
jgi:amidase